MIVILSITAFLLWFLHGFIVLTKQQVSKDDYLFVWIMLMINLYVNIIR